MNKHSRCVWLLIVPCCLALAVMGPTNTGKAAPRIELKDFRIEPMSLRLGESFVIRARAVATGVRLGSFLLRTANEIKRQNAIPGLPLYTNGKYYMTEDGRYFLKDNGKLDRDPRQNAFALEISTEGWKEGRYSFAFFASCRPSAGPFIAARHNFLVVVKGQRVLVEDLGPDAINRSRAITGFNLEPLKVKPGGRVKLLLRVRPEVVSGIRITNPFYVEATETLPGFRYDSTEKKAFFGEPHPALMEDNGRLDQNPAAGVISLELDTSGWSAGVHHLVLNAVGSSGRTADYRAFAVKVTGPQDRLDVTVEGSWHFGPGTHFGRFVKLSCGTLLCAGKSSRDGGRTWQGATGGFGTGAEQLRDGRILGLQYRCLPEKGKDGWYRVERSLSTDGGRSFQKTAAQVYVPEAKAAMGHAFHPGPLFMRSIVERADGSLVALMCGWFKSDTALCPYGRGRPYSRSYLCESDDVGQTWRYLNTIGYDRIGSEGYNEGSMKRLPNGELLVVLRTGNEKDFKCQDNPIMWSVSRDEGRTWSSPGRTGLEGAYPSLAVLSDGLVAISYGRPGAMLAFSADSGRTWTGRTSVDATPYSGYTDVVEIGKGLLLVGFGTKDYLDPETGIRQNQLRLARVRYSRPQ